MDPVIIVEAVIFYLVLGGAAGLLSGMLGIGGGLIVVPGLAFAFHYHDLPHDSIMQIAIGTSFAIMIVTSLRSLLGHMSHQDEFWEIFKRLLPGLTLGVVAGALLAHSLPSKTLGVVFGVFVVLLVIRLFFFNKTNTTRALPGRLGMVTVGSCVGLTSGLLGIGGGALTVPYLLHCNVPIRRAVVVSVLTTLLIALLGALSFVVIGFHETRHLPWTTGYIHWPAWFAVSLGSMLFAPLGVKLSHRCQVKVLRRVFAIFMLFVAIHLFLRAM